MSGGVWVAARGDTLVAMKNARIRADTDAIAKSLQGNWRTKHLFALKQALAIYDFVAPPN